MAEPAEQEKLRDILVRHGIMTGSPLSRELLADWEHTVQRFTRVIPRDYEEMQQLIRKYREEGYEEKEAVERAFQEKIG